MPTLCLSRRVAVGPDDPFDGPGCSVVVERRRGVSRGWVALLRPSGGRRYLEPARAVYHPSRDMTLLTFTDLAPGTYEAHSALTDTRAHRVVFEVEGHSELLARFRIVSPRPGQPEQLALFDPCRAVSETPEPSPGRPAWRTLGGRPRPPGGPDDFPAVGPARRARIDRRRSRRESTEPANPKEWEES